MLSYNYDKKTGGILLNTAFSPLSKEPRPVYARELDLLGFSRYLSYEQQNAVPYMWAESNYYYYRGELVAKLRGGSFFESPEIIPEKNYEKKPGTVKYRKHLKPMDIRTMVASNEDKLKLIEQQTVRKIKDVFEKYNGTLDCFHVAFSGGKDSIVLLDLIKKTLPKKSYIVVFGDTGMEFPDTYDVIQKVKRQCEQESIPFYVAQSHIDINDSWRIFGPPSRTLRWCCHVHKSSPPTSLLRQITGKPDYVGLDFVGVRAHESSRRASYTELNFGKKQRGQYSHNSILEWTSAEVWLYIFANDLIINEAYKKGNTRVGCLCCPMSSGASDYFRMQSYSSEVNRYIDHIKASYLCDEKDTRKINSYVSNGGWHARRNGRDLKDNVPKCIERTGKSDFSIFLRSPKSNWQEWIKTIGISRMVGDTCYLRFNDNEIEFTIQENADTIEVVIKNDTLKTTPLFSKLFRQVFHKAAYCIGCGVCETNCRNGRLKFDEKGKVKISNCLHCFDCHSIDSGCLLFHSLRLSQDGGLSMKKKSLNTFADHAPKTDWFDSFFNLKDDFFINHTLGPMMYDMFRRFLKDAGLNESNHFTPFAELVSNIGWDSETSLGLMLVNLASQNPQFQWYIRNLEIGKHYERDQIENNLVSNFEVKIKDAKSIFKAFKRIIDTPFGSVLHFGYYDKDSTNKKEYVGRTKCQISDMRVLLYSLFRFAEDCGNYMGFTLTTLMDNTAERNGISPIQIFGFSRDEMIPMLNGLAVRYPEFINVSFTHDLEMINLESDKSHDDVLGIFN